MRNPQLLAAASLVTGSLNQYFAFSRYFRTHTRTANEEEEVEQAPWNAEHSWQQFCLIAFGLGPPLGHVAMEDHVTGPFENSESKYQSHSPGLNGITCRRRWFFYSSAFAWQLCH